jgi:hypothetical protein
VAAVKGPLVCLVLGHMTSLFPGPGTTSTSTTGFDDDLPTLHILCLEPQGSGERNYHIFFQLLAGTDAVEKEVLHLREASTYKYLSAAVAEGSSAEQDFDDAAEFGNIKEVGTMTHTKVTY